MKANTGTPDTRLVSLNVGVSRLLDHSGRPVQSGISETPVEIALWIDENRLEGDESAHAQVPADTLPVVVTCLRTSLTVGGQYIGLHFHLRTNEVYGRLRHLRLQIQGGRYGVQKAYQQEGESEAKPVLGAAAFPHVFHICLREEKVPSEQLRSPLATQGLEASPFIYAGGSGDER